MLAQENLNLNVIYLKIERELKRAKGIRSLIEKKLFVVGILTSEFRKSGITPVVVGGSAVEFYTSGVYESLDIDLVIEKKEKIKVLFKKLGFEKKGRHWFHPDYEIDIEIVGLNLSGSKEMLTKVNIEDYKVFVIGIEDLIVDRLCACKFWNSTLDCEQANVLLNTHKDKIDHEYLKNRAEQEEVIEKLDEIFKDINVCT